MNNSNTKNTYTNTSSISSTTAKRPTTTATLTFPGAIGTICIPNSITKILRPHQVEGIVFLWNCLLGCSVPFQKVFSRINDNEDKDKDKDKDKERRRDKQQQQQYATKMPCGAILADEMGLGKTLMTISIILAMYRKNRLQRFIVVCPSSLVGNWSKEFDKWVRRRSRRRESRILV
jgi:SNF2 family DNA or RNA helicase